MEFKTEGYWVSIETGGNVHVYVGLFVWVLLCSHQNSLLVVSLRGVLIAASRFLKACAAAITPRRSKRKS